MCLFTAGLAECTSNSRIWQAEIHIFPQYRTPWYHRHPPLLSRASWISTVPGMPGQRGICQKSSWKPEEVRLSLDSVPKRRGFPSCRQVASLAWKENTPLKCGEASGEQPEEESSLKSSQRRRAARRAAWRAARGGEQPEEESRIFVSQGSSRRTFFVKRDKH